MKSPAQIRYEISCRAKARKEALTAHQEEASKPFTSYENGLLMKFSSFNAYCKYLKAEEVKAKMNNAHRCLNGLTDFKRKVQLKYWIAKEYVSLREEYRKLTQY